MKLLKPKRNQTIVVEVAAAPSKHKFFSLLQVDLNGNIV